MIPNLPIWVFLTFGLAVAIVIYFAYQAFLKHPQGTEKSTKVLLGVLLLLIASNSFFALSGIMQEDSADSPRMFLGIVPTMVVFIAFLIVKWKWIIELDAGSLTLLHLTRIPVEVVLWQLAVAKLVPENLTFIGSNFDILAGVTAPIMFWLYFKKKALNRELFIAWNVICLFLLYHIVSNAVLVTPFFAGNYDGVLNTGVLYFPYSLLPGIIVPLVMFSHIITLVQLIKKKI